MNGRELVQEFKRRHDLSFPKSPLCPVWGRDGKLMKDMVESLGEAEVFLRAEAYFLDEKPYYMLKGFPVWLFAQNVGDYDKFMPSQARARVESRKSRQSIEEYPGRNREGKSEPNELGDIIKKIQEHQ